MGMHSYNFINHPMYAKTQLIKKKVVSYNEKKQAKEEKAMANKMRS